MLRTRTAEPEMGPLTRQWLYPEQLFGFFVCFPGQRYRDHEQPIVHFPSRTFPANLASWSLSGERLMLQLVRADLIGSCCRWRNSQIISICM